MKGEGPYAHRAARPVAVLVALIISGCASTPTGGLPLDPASLLQDDVFLADPPQLAIDAVDLYELPAPLEQDLDQKISTFASEEDRFRALRRWIFDEAGKYEYDPDTTAAIADLARVGKINCFSFSILYVAAARHLDLSADVQLVYSPPDWGLAEENWTLNQHINVAGTARTAVDDDWLTRRADLPPETGTRLQKTMGRVKTRRYVVDLDPEIVVNASRTERLDDHQVLARFYANKGVEALVAGNHALAYLYNREALRADPTSSPAWTNLGVLYARADRPDLARRTYRTAIRVDPDADSARNNLALLYRRTGEEDKAVELEKQIRARRRRNPYYHHMLGRHSFDAGDYEEAVAHYRDALRRKRDEELFYLSLAEAQLALDHEDAARDSLRRSRRYAERDNAELLVSIERALAERAASPEM